MLVKKIEQISIHGAPSAPAIRLGYNGHVYWACGGTSCVNQHIINSAMTNKKWIYIIVEIFILGIVEFKKNIYFPKTGHHGQ